MHLLTVAIVVATVIFAICNAMNRKVSRRKDSIEQGRCGPERDMSKSYKAIAKWGSRIGLAAFLASVGLFMLVKGSPFLYDYRDILL
jgi:hypothetical protein